MMDLKYIIKRVIIGTLIALAVMFIKQNVYAYEWETEVDTLQDTSSINFTNTAYLSVAFNMNPSYPLAASNSQTSFGPTQGIYGGNYLSNLIPIYYNSLTYDLSGFSFESDTYYKIIIPIAYNSTVFTDLTSNFNTEKILDSNTYSFNNENWSVYSASFAFGVSNDIEINATYPEYMYFSIIFSGSQPVTDLKLYINGNTNTSHTLTAFNTISDSNYLFKTKFTCTAPVNSRDCTYYTRRGYKPFLYTTGVGPDGCQGSGCYLDGQDVADNTSTDIKDQIGQIIDGQFTDDLNLPDLNGGGRKFGDNEYSVQDLLVMPLEFIKKLTTNDTCSPLSVPVPGLSGTMQLPCLSAFASSMLGANIVDLIKLILGCILGFKILVALYNSILHILSPDHLLYVDDIF